MVLDGMHVSINPNDEALNVRFDGEFADEGQTIEAQISLSYSSDTLKSIKGYLHNSERERVNNMFERFMSQFLEDLYMSLIDEIPEE